MKNIDPQSQLTKYIASSGATVERRRFPLERSGTEELNSLDHIISQPLAPYEHPSPMAHVLWRVPGHEQLAVVIGLGNDNLIGNFAIPGWVIQSLIARSPQDRVPVVFVITENHRAPLPAFDQFNFEGPI